MEGRDPEQGGRPSGTGRGRDRSVRVIIADDQKVFREALVELITRRPCLDLVGVAGDATGAVELAGRLQPDVAVLDVRMPGGGGPEAARRIRDCSPATAIVALSAFQDRDSVTQMTQAETKEYLVKGEASPAEIVAAIHSASPGSSG